jgi:WD40 repeat protein
LGYYRDKLLTGSYDSTIRVWKIDDEKCTGEWLHTLQGPAGEIQALEYSPDCLLAAAGSTDTIARVFDLTSGKK